MSPEAGSNVVRFVVAVVGLLLAAPAAPEPLVVTDPSSVNVCERVPGADVAKALGTALRSERSIVFRDSKLSRCVYLIGPPGEPDAPTAGLGDAAGAMRPPRLGWPG